MSTEDRDSEVAERPVEGEVLEILVQNRDRFLAFLTRRLGNRETAEDILQQGLARAMEKADQLLSVEGIVPWFYRILANATIDHYRASGSRDQKLRQFLEYLESTGADRVQSSEVRTEICGCIDGLLPTLNKGYADLLRRIDLSGEPLDKVGAELRLTPNNLSVKLHRARKALKESLKRSCGSCSEHGCLDCDC